MTYKIIDQMNQEFKNLVFRSTIRSNIALAQAQEEGLDIFNYSPRSNGAMDYTQFALEFLERLPPNH